MNCLSVTCSGYSRYWRFVFSLIKSCLLIFRPDLQTNVDVLLCEHSLKVVNGHLHVGVPLCSSTQAESELVRDRVKSCRRKYFMMESVGTPHMRLSPLHLSRLYNSVCLTSLSYGCVVTVWAVWSPSLQSMQELEAVHQQIGRRIQGLPPNTSAPASYSTLGWEYMEAIFDLAKLMWVWRLLALSYESVYHRLALRCFVDCRFHRDSGGPFAAVYHVCAKYKLVGVLQDMMESGNSYLTAR